MFDGGNPLIELCSEEMEAPAALLDQLFHLPAASAEVSLDRKYCTRLMGSRMCNPPLPGYPSFPLPLLGQFHGRALLLLLLSVCSSCMSCLFSSFNEMMQRWNDGITQNHCYQLSAATLDLSHRPHGLKQKKNSNFDQK